MERRRWLQAAVLMSLLLLCSGRELKSKRQAPAYNSTLAKTLAEYTSAVYTNDLSQLFSWTCEKCVDLTEGFEVIELIIDVKNCLEAYVGFASDMNAVVVAFRGTQENSIQNWIEDLFWKQLDFDYPGMSEAKVHSGFYSAYHNTTLRDGVINGIQKTREAYGNIPIMVTGHSMGGAMASFCALDLIVNYGLKDVTLLTFGQPRIGNAVFASHFKMYLPNAIRVTNAHDIVPHLPPYYQYFPQKTYHHFPREVWVHNIGLDSLVYPIEQICDDSGEDPTCSRSVSGNSVQDHIHYLGISMHSESRGSCRIVTDDNMLRYKVGTVDGTIVFSKQPGLSVDQLLSVQ
ncbi:Lipase [Hordeum vulgare]|uniref:Fungal lipase-type domain-containing protein n=1 Tax=Hordeum vulgare subsp. vulgare TaxID=112509 RepID=A0A8I6WQP5_HORVV|nr:lipase-like [Hordeum vulgare subsp. vulgare]KAE8821818.1 Lipase [Hordeum vulgare]